MIVNSLALIIVLRTEHAGFGRDRLRRFVGLETLEELLLPLGGRDVANAAIGQHGGVVHLQILGIDFRHFLQRFDGLFVISLQKLQPRHLIPHHAIARIFGIHDREILQRGIVVAIRFLDQRAEIIGAAQFGSTASDF